MAELRVVALIKAKAGNEETVGEALRQLAEASRGDKGCLSYELFRSNEEPTTFVTVESWESEADLQAHMQAPALAAAMQAAGELLDGPPQIHPLSALSPA